MKAKISTIIHTNEDEIWDELLKVSSLIYVASPILRFRPQLNHTLPEKWELGKEYKLKLSFFNVIPLGDHIIKVVEINKQEKVIISNEYGNLTKVWNHTIKLMPIDNNRIRYTDEIDIQSGLLTLFVWLFAHFFYRHRQIKWKKLLKR